MLRMTEGELVALKLGRKAKASKYRNVPTIVDGFRFQSKLEARRYIQLCLLWKAGDVLWFSRQCPFWLDGGTKWIADFVVVWKGHSEGCSVTIEDAKGRRSDSYKIKRREIEAKYGFKITEVTEAWL